MGYIKHHTIVVTGSEEHTEKVRQKAVEIFEETCKDDLIQAPYGSKIVSPIVGSLANNQRSFFIAPDGSKEGWQTSHNADEARASFLNWLKGSNSYCDYIEIVFGGDDDYKDIVRSIDTD